MGLKPVFENKKFRVFLKSWLEVKKNEKNALNKKS